MRGPTMIFFLYIIAVNFFIKSTADIVMSKEIKVQIDPPETTVEPTQYLPIILSSASQLPVLVGDSVVLPCRVEHLRHHVVIWKRGRTRTLFAGLLRVDHDKKFSLTDRTFLQIERVTPEYAGEYICQVNTKPPIELVHTLYVLVSPTVSVDPEDGHVIVKEGDPVMARCMAEGYPTPVVTWRAIKGSLPGGVKEKQGSILSIPSTDVRHTGVYECKAENGVGEPAITLVRIKVFYAPELSVTPTWQHAGDGSTVEFKCIASSEPPPSLYWTRIPRTILTEDEHISLQNISKPPEQQLILKIRRITQEHFGTYSCFANNSIGSAFRTVEVSGLAEPVKFKSNSSGDETNSFLLLWTVKSYSTVIEYMLRIRPHKSKDSSSRAPSWIDVMIPVSVQQRVLHSHSYNITGLEPGTGYEVVMQARNDFGWNHPSETFTFYTDGGEPQADEWEMSTFKEETSPSVYVTDLPMQITDFESNWKTAAEKSSASRYSFPSFVIVLLVFCLIS